MMNPNRRQFLSLAGAAVATPALAQADPLVARAAAPPRPTWVETWAAAHQPPPASGVAAEGFTDRTLRMIAHTSVGGNRVRIRLTNKYGSSDLKVAWATIGVQRSGASIVAGTVRTVTFAGAPRTVIAPGAHLVSDPVDLKVTAGHNLVISLYVPGPTGPVTHHPRSIQTNFHGPGNTTRSTSDPGYETVTAWFYLAGVSVESSQQRAAIVCIGDSITNGTGSSLDSNRRYPDVLADRLAVNHPQVSVVQAGINGNRLLTSSPPYGSDSGIQRFADDVVRVAGVRTVVLLEGINDIQSTIGPVPGVPVTTEDVIAGLHTMIGQAHAASLRIVGGTMTPVLGSNRYSESSEQMRVEVNEWIRTSGAFDAVVDFEAAVRDPANPKQLLPAFDDGSHLHPNDHGYRAMAEAFDLDRLAAFTLG